ncbi:hypothetical protein [Bradyrhizobium genosp. A]|uniref:hypothetical protein n=1 Tax=Bradyrhizobium genosp. A TaxID=83626 RepID=UPI003CF1E562
MRKTAYVFAIAALIGSAAAWMLHARPQAVEFSTAAMPSLQELHKMAGVESLSSQEIHDQSLVYPTPPNQ